MSRRNRGNGKMQRIVQEGEFTPVDDVQKQEAINEHQGGTVNLDDVAFMVVVGRYKNGDPFLLNVNVNDIMTVRGLLEWGIDEVKDVADEWRQAKKAEAKGE